MRPLKDRDRKKGSLKADALLMQVSYSEKNVPLGI